jgi:hypothetical protein
MKKCNICLSEKELTDFYKNRASKDGAQGRCIECAKKINKDHYKQNKEYNYLRCKEYRGKNKDKLLANAVRWQNNNPNYFAQKNKFYYQADRARFIAKVSLRRSKKIQATPPWLSCIEKAMTQEMYDIAVALSVQSGILHEVDHIHPLAGDGYRGLHVPWNLRVIPKIDNLRKRNNFPFDERHLFWLDEEGA